MPMHRHIVKLNRLHCKSVSIPFTDMATYHLYIMLICLTNVDHRVSLFHCSPIIIEDAVSSVKQYRPCTYVHMYIVQVWSFVML